MRRARRVAPPALFLGLGLALGLWGGADPLRAEPAAPAAPSAASLPAAAPAGVVAGPPGRSDPPGLPAAPARDPTPGPADPPGGAAADESPGGRFAWHVQSTLVEQANDGFASPYAGPNSLWPHANGRETFDLTLYGGARLWRGAEVWFDGEVDQGFGLTGTLGVAGFPSGEAYKVGSSDPYPRLQRAFFRQTLDLGGEASTAEADLNQFRERVTADRLVFTVGKFSVGDVFDTNVYAHDPRGDFLNWTIIDAGTFDYAADAWGYSAGATLEWWTGPWTLRGGVFLLSDVPNSPKIDTRFDQMQGLAEVERRFALDERPGALKVTAFLSRGRMAKLLDAVRFAEETGGPPAVARVRRYASRPGVDLNLQQELAAGVGLFARIGAADGRYETYEFTDVDRSASGGVSVSGARWGRKDDVFALAGVVNEASRDRLLYLADGGLGILVGDGRLPHPRTEKILETYYALPLGPVRASLDYQLIVDPAFNADRGPVSMFGLRLHVQR